MSAIAERDREYRRLFDFFFIYRGVALGYALILLVRYQYRELNDYNLFAWLLMALYTAAAFAKRDRVFEWLRSRPWMLVIDIFLAGGALFLVGPPDFPFYYYSLAPMLVAGLLYSAKRVTLAAAAMVVSTFASVYWHQGSLLPALDRELGMLTGRPLSYFVVGYMVIYPVRLIEQITSQKRQIADYVEQTATAKERRRLARELHDNLAQILGGIKLKAEAWRAGGLAPDAVSEQIAQSARAGQQELRKTIFALRDENFAYPLDEILRRYSERLAQTGFAVHIETSGSLPLISDTIRMELFRLCQEALANAEKHSGRTEANISIAVDKDCLSLKISDHGRGFEASPDNRFGFGLTSMRERAVGLGGKLDITSRPNEGTEVAFSIPLASSIGNGDDVALPADQLGSPK